MLLLAISPPNDLDRVASLVWQAVNNLRRVVRAGEQRKAEALSIWLANTRAAGRCTPRLARLIDDALSEARGRTAPDAPFQPDGGEAA